MADGAEKQMYNFDGDACEHGFDPYSLNEPEFNPDLYLHKLLQECKLTQLTQKEHKIFYEIQLLDSEMQTLVYENYNKFISATDTIRKMKKDFKKMEEEMEHLSANMSVMTEFSSDISGTLQGRRQKITKLSSVHTLLKKLQFLFELPLRLKNCIENDRENYSLAVNQYLKAQKVLHQYSHMPSFHGILKDCNFYVSELKTRLRAEFRDKDATSKQLTKCVDLLLQLGEPAEVLCEEFLEHASKEKLNVDLDELKHQVNIYEKKLLSAESELETHMEHNSLDVLEFVDFSYNTFLSNISLVIASYGDLFLHRLPKDSESATDIAIPLKKLESFVQIPMEEYFRLIAARISLDKNTADNAIFLRALDRFYRKIETMNRLLRNVNFFERSVEIINNSSKDRCVYYLENLKQHLTDSIVSVRQNLAIPTAHASIVNQDSTTNRLSELLNFLETSIVDSMKCILTDLHGFIHNDISFSSNMLFNELFCRKFVLEDVVIAFFQHLNDTALEYCSNCANDKSAASSPQLVLLLSRLCLNMEQSTVSSLISVSEELFKIQAKDSVTPVSVICSQLKETAQKLINHFVSVQGLNVSQMLRKSVETRDWLHAVEPRSVRAVMKRVLEDITSIDFEVGQIYEEGLRKDRSSDSLSLSSRATFPASSRTRNKYNAYAPSTLDNSLMSNIQKLFSDRIDIFSPVEFSKVSVMTGIIKISLKTFLECVRLRSFSTYGLQQTQVDSHYLQLYLWHFVADENLVYALLDEIMGSAINRCFDPVLMDPSVIEVICEKG